MFASKSSVIILGVMVDIRDGAKIAYTARAEAAMVFWLRHRK